MRLNVRKRVLLLSLIVATVVVTTVVNQFAFGPAEADSEEHTTLALRIAAQRLEDGRVELAFQRQGDDGQWGPRIPPRLRRFPVDAEVGRWLYSSPIEFAAPIPLTPPLPMICVVADGDPDSHFWQMLEFHTKRGADNLGLHVKYSSHPDVDTRIAAIEECVEDDAPLLLASLADADDVIPALHTAAAAGVKIATFGAGERHADRAGSLIHVSFNESAAGRRAVEQFESRFAERSVSGPLLCLYKEGNPQGRTGICDVVDELYEGGDMEQVELTASDRASQIEQILNDHQDAAGLLVVEGDLLPPAIAAIQKSGVSPVLGSVGEYQLNRLSFAERDLIAFMVMDLARVETLLPMAALHYTYRYHPNARFFEGAMLFGGEPNTHVGGALGGHGRPPSEDETEEHDHSHGDDDHDQ